MESRLSNGASPSSRRYSGRWLLILGLLGGLILGAVGGERYYNCERGYDGGEFAEARTFQYVLGGCGLGVVLGAVVGFLANRISRPEIQIQDDPSDHTLAGCPAVKTAASGAGTEFEALGVALLDADPSVRREACRKLPGLPLIVLLYHENPLIRARMARLLAATQDRRAPEPFMQFLGDAAPAVR